MTNLHDNDCEPSSTVDNDRQQSSTNVHKINNSKSKDKIKEKDKENIKTKENTSSADSREKDSIPLICTLPLVDGSDYGISEDEYQEDIEAFPGCDVMQEYRRMRRWLDSNPRNKKTRSGIRRFMTNWLSHEQNRSHPAPQSSMSVINPFLEALKRGDLQ